VVNVAIPIKHSLYMHYNRDVMPLPAVATVQEMIRESFAGMRESLPVVDGSVVA
jgi:hypothetical protein